MILDGRQCLTQIYSLLLICRTVLLISDSEFSKLKRERAETAKAWAPLVYLHPKETVFPTAVHTFLANVIPQEVSESSESTDSPLIISINRSVKAQSLPEGTASKDSYLIAPIDPECKNCPLPKFLYGEKPSAEYSPPIYAIITSCLPTKSKKHKKYDRTSRSYTRPRLGKRIKDGIIRAGRHIRNQYLSRRNNKRRVDGSKETIISQSTVTTTPRPSDDAMNYVLQSEELSSRKDPDASYDSSNFIDETIENASYELLSKEDLPLDDDIYHFHDLIDHIVTANASQEELFLNVTSTTPTTNVLSPVENITLSTVSPLVKDTVYYPKPRPKRKWRKGHHYTVTYWMFYPFSRGKPICTSKLWLLGRVFKPRIRNKCYGDEITVNDHVGDWEHVSIFFEDGLPKKLYISSHYFGAYYEYSPKSNTFQYIGKDTRSPLPLSAKFPPVIKVKGSHPIIYAALGSHGLWGAPGSHKYLNFIQLSDETSTGTPWKTWRNLDIIDYRDPNIERPDRQWMRFHGRWGNPSYGCHKGLFGICYLSKGPTGIPKKRDNFPCHLPNDKTFHPKP